MGSPSEIPPEVLLGGKIRLIQRIGRGGMGDVWIARNEATQAEIAVKTLQKSERTTVHDERFRREARLAATISHRNVVRVFDLVDEADGTLGLVMELLRGGTLEGCMRERGPLAAAQAVAVAVPILSALHHVHQKGIVHRDMKPANVFFAVEPDGHVIPKILDFGIAKLPAAGSALTMDGSVLGTPHYMSPEQIRGQEDLDGRSDMFSVAVVVYEMLTGTRVFQRDSAAASLAAVLEHEVDPDPRIPPRLWVALSRALAKRPYERYGTCAELADALRAAANLGDEDLTRELQELRPRSEVALDSAGGVAESVRSRPRKKDKGRRSGVVILAVAGVAAALSVAVTLGVTRSGATASAAEDTPSRAPAASAPTSPPPPPVVPAREAIPPPAPVTSPPVVELSGEATDDAPGEATDDATDEVTDEAPPARASARPRTKAPRAAAPATHPARKTTAPKPKKKVATTPGF